MDFLPRLFRSPTSFSNKTGTVHQTNRGGWISNTNQTIEKNWKTWNLPRKKRGESSKPFRTNQESKKKKKRPVPDRPPKLGGPSTGRVPDIHSGAEPIFPTLPAPVPPLSSGGWPGRWWCLGKIFFGWKQRKARLVFIKKNAMFVYIYIYYICRRKQTDRNYLLSIFVLKKMGLKSKILKKKKGKVVLTKHTFSWDDFCKLPTPSSWKQPRLKN